MSLLSLSKLRVLLVLSLGMLAGLLAAPTVAQTYPARPVRIVVPFSPGGGTDILARLIAQKLTQSLGQQVIVDNRPGAGSRIGTEIVVRATPDGYTFLMVSATYAVNAAIYRLDFDPAKDLLPVAQMASVPFVLVAHPSLPVSNVKELIALAKARPGQIIYASTGNGSSPHLAGELLAMMTNVRMVHVPYKGGGPAMIDLLSGQVQLLFNTVVQSLPHINSGRLKPLAVGSLKRSSVLPQVMTIDESGVRGYDITNWFGLLVPGKTPQSIVARINRDVVQHLQAADFKAQLVRQGAEPAGGTPADFGKLIRGDIAKFSRIVKAAGIRIE
ncbi:MAG: tripartite tricarboxylate transporter substrate binding protein [Betaproteobacteria bacterium]|nr:tripartite tricarboxylate transporter substrate binding protein [Betaproteobacteria bacterium]